MHENIDVPHKAGCAARAPLDRGASAHGDGGTVKGPTSSFKIDFSLTPEQFVEGTTPNAQWDTKAPRAIGDPPFVRRPPDTLDRKFIARSTFSDAYDNGSHAKQQDYPLDVTATGLLRPVSTVHPIDPGPFYRTETQQKSSEGNLLMAPKRILPPGPEPMVRANRQFSGVNLRYPELSTSYRDSFGAFGVDPNSKLPANPAQIKFNASTKEYFQGTTKASHHPPGYSGFIPETGRNVHASGQGQCPAPREGTKAFELQTLFQYPHQVPGYAGYRPVTAINDRGPTRDESLTTSGRANIAATGGFEVRREPSVRMLVALSPLLPLCVIMPVIACARSHSISDSR